MTRPRPALVLVHGAAHGVWTWDRLIEELGGTEVHTVALPSSGTGPGALGDLRADAAAVRTAVEALDGPVVVCAHSYGGLPVTEGLAGVANVARLVYLCSFQLDVGESLTSAAGGTLPEWWEVHEEQDHVVATDPRERFYADVDAATADAAVARLGRQSLTAFRQPLTAAAWRSIPSTYVVCEQDESIPPFAQEAMARRAGRVVRMAASHSPFLSQPARLAEILTAELDEAAGVALNPA